MDWIDANQLGRRNLTPDQMSFIRGRRYNRVKKATHGNNGGANQFTKQLGGHFDHQAINTTAETLAKQHGVSPTIRRCPTVLPYPLKTPLELVVNW